ncbi:MAG: hypothetical protein CM15mP23_23060 [Cryomorphaceae bacterium]|nr:MAG: hypothetical protein CM15mP23_23060 [Cryomorphaceae bacterium]
MHPELFFQYTYNDAGAYSVSLTATGPGGTDSIKKPNYLMYPTPFRLLFFLGDDPTTGKKF